MICLPSSDSSHESQGNFFKLKFDLIASLLQCPLILRIHAHKLYHKALHGLSSALFSRSAWCLTSCTHSAHSNTTLILRMHHNLWDLIPGPKTRLPSTTALLLTNHTYPSDLSVQATFPTKASEFPTLICKLSLFNLLSYLPYHILTAWYFFVISISPIKLSHFTFATLITSTESDISSTQHSVNTSNQTKLLVALIFLLDCLVWQFFIILVGKKVHLTLKNNSFILRVSILQLSHSRHSS